MVFKKDLLSRQASRRRMREGEGEFFLSSSKKKVVRRELKERSSVTRKAFKGLGGVTRQTVKGFGKVSRSKLKFKSTKDKRLKLDLDDSEGFEEFMF